jgi:hypothetical protein
MYTQSIDPNSPFGIPTPPATTTTMKALSAQEQMGVDPISKLAKAVDRLAGAIEDYNENAAPGRR